MPVNAQYNKGLDIITVHCSRGQCMCSFILRIGRVSMHYWS